MGVRAPCGAASESATRGQGRSVLMTLRNAAARGSSHWILVVVSMEQHVCSHRWREVFKVIFI